MIKNSKVYIGATVCTLVYSLNAQAENYLSSSEISALISGKTLDGIHLKKDFAYKTYSSPDGIVTQVKNDGERRTGKWSINDNDKHCVEWDDTGIEKCFPVRDNGDGSYTKVKIKGNKVIPLIRWSNFNDGNNL